MSLVSVIMPYYKKELYVSESVESILNQSYTNFEIILINDDENRNFINKISNLDHRIKLIHNNINLGAGLSRNKGIKLSKGEYIAFCDCDDLWKKNKLEIQLNFMKQFNLNFCYTSYDVIDKNSELADAFGASTTPHVFLLDSEFKLIYKGAIDDNVKSKSSVKSNWVKDAVISTGKNEPISLAETRNSGCSIKRL